MRHIIGTFAAPCAAAGLSWKELFARHVRGLRTAEPEFWASLMLAALAGVVATLNASHAHLGVVQVPGFYPELYRRLQVFSETVQLIRKDFVDLVDDNLLIKGAIEGMFSALDPPLSLP